MVHQTGTRKSKRLQAPKKNKPGNSSTWDSTHISAQKIHPHKGLERVPESIAVLIGEVFAVCKSSP